MFKRYGLIYIGLCLILLTACSSAAIKKPANPIKLGLLRIEDSLPFFVAQEEDVFLKKGIMVELISFNSARERDIALEAGEIHGEVADLLAAALIKKGGTSVKIVSIGLGASPAEGRFAILAAPGSQIMAPADLNNVPVAISQYTIIHYLADEMIKETGLNSGYIKFQNIPDMKLRLESLLSGNDVRAALLPDPMAALAEKMGARVIIDDTKLNSNLSQTVILFQEQTLLELPDQVKGILASFQEGATLLNDNPDKYRALFVEKTRIPQPLEYSYNIPKFSPLQLPTEEMIRRVMTWMTEKSLLEKAYMYEELVAPGYIP